MCLHTVTRGKKAPASTQYNVTVYNHSKTQGKKRNKTQGKKATRTPNHQPIPTWDTPRGGVRTKREQVKRTGGRTWANRPNIEPIYIERDYEYIIGSANFQELPPTICSTE